MPAAQNIVWEGILALLKPSFCHINFGFVITPLASGNCVNLRKYLLRVGVGLERPCLSQRLSSPCSCPISTVKMLHTTSINDVKESFVIFITLLNLCYVCPPPTWPDTVFEGVRNETYSNHCLCITQLTQNQFCSYIGQHRSLAERRGFDFGPSVYGKLK